MNLLIHSIVGRFIYNILPVIVLATSLGLATVLLKQHQTLLEQLVGTWQLSPTESARR